MIWIRKDIESNLKGHIITSEARNLRREIDCVGDLSRLRSRLVARLRQDAFAVLMSQDCGFVDLYHVDLEFEV